MLKGRFYVLRGFNREKRKLQMDVSIEPIIDRLADIKMQSDYGSSALSQYAVDKWLKSGLFEDYLTNIRAELKFRRDFILQLLKKYFSNIAT